MNQRQNAAPKTHKITHNENEETAFTEVMETPEFAEFEKISQILRLMNSLDINTTTRYRTYIAGNTAK